MNQKRKNYECLDKWYRIWYQYYAEGKSWAEWTQKCILERPFFLLSIQRMKGGKAKAYQVRQLIDFIEANDLDKPDKKE